MTQTPSSVLSSDYPVSERCRLRRNPKRAVTDRAAVHAVLDAGLQCAVGYVFDGEPYVTQTAYWREGERVYWHGSSASQMIRRLKGGIPVCFTASILDGLVFARSGFHHSFNYRSVVAHGIAQEVTQPAEKLARLKAFTDRLAPGRWEEMRPPTEQEMKATTVLALALDEISCKIREGGPVDDADDMDAPIWAGVVPVALVLGTSITDPESRIANAPANCLGTRLG